MSNTFSVLAFSIAAALAVEFAIITFVAHWPAGFCGRTRRLGVSAILAGLPRPLLN
jgi:hypothetical protein